MKIEEIQKSVNELQAALSAKGKTGTVAKFTVESHVVFSICLTWQRAGTTSFCDVDMKFIDSGTAQGAFDKAREFIAALPNAQEAKLREFMGAVGNAIEIGRKNGIEIDFMNPLAETMKRLSENVLTDQRVAS